MVITSFSFIIFFCSVSSFFWSIVCFHSELVSLWDEKVRKLPLNLWNSHQSNILESCLTWDEVSLHLDTSSFHADTKLELKLEISSIINVVRLDLFFCDNLYFLVILQRLAFLWYLYSQPNNKKHKNKNADIKYFDKILFPSIILKNLLIIKNYFWSLYLSLVEVDSVVSEEKKFNIFFLSKWAFCAKFL